MAAMTTLKGDVSWGKDLQDLADYYVNYIKANLTDTSVLKTEMNRTMELANGIKFNIIIDAFIIEGKRAEIVDFKTSTSKIDQTQNKIYGLWAVKEYNLDEIKLTVVQPRHAQKIDSQVFTRVELLEFEREIMEKVQSIALDCNPSPICKHCEIRNICAAR